MAAFGGWKVRRTSLQFKKGCSGSYVEPFAVVHSSVVSLSFSLSSGEVLSSELSVGGGSFFHVAYSVSKSVPSFSRTFYCYISHLASEVLLHLTVLVLGYMNRSYKSSLSCVMGLGTVGQ